MPWRPDRSSPLLAAFLALGLLAPAAAPAAESVAFTPAALQAARSAGKPVLVEISAPWCPTCRAQKAALPGILSAPKYAGLVHFDVDFDSQKPALRELGVAAQSTLIVYRGEREAGRSLGEVRPAEIRALIDKAY